MYIQPDFSCYLILLILGEGYFHRPAVSHDGAVIDVAVEVVAILRQPFQNWSPIVKYGNLFNICYVHQ